MQKSMVLYAFDKNLFFRLIRIFRLFRFFKNLSGMQVIYQALKSSAQELCLLIILMLIPMLIFSTLIFYAESGAEGKVGEGGESITSITLLMMD